MKDYFRCLAKTTDGKTTLIANEIYANSDGDAFEVMAARDGKTKTEMRKELKEMGVVSLKFVKE